MDAAWRKSKINKTKAHIQRYENLKNQKGIVEDDKIELSSIKSRMGKTTIELDKISKTYGDDTVLIKDFSYNFLKGDRVGFVGKNGCGKTTLMKIIDGRIKPDSGTVTIGQTIKIGYYTQEIETDQQGGIAYMDPQEKVIDYIKTQRNLFVQRMDLYRHRQCLKDFYFHHLNSIAK